MYKAIIAFVLFSFTLINCQKDEMNLEDMKPPKREKTFKKDNEGKKLRNDLHFVIPLAYNTVKASLLMKHKRYEEAILHLDKAIKLINSKNQK